MHAYMYKYASHARIYAHMCAYMRHKYANMRIYAEAARGLLPIFSFKKSLFVYIVIKHYFYGLLRLFDHQKSEGIGSRFYLSFEKLITHFYRNQISSPHILLNMASNS